MRGTLSGAESVLPVRAVILGSGIFEMKVSLLRYLICPACCGDLEIVGADSTGNGHVEEGALACPKCPARYPIRRGVPRFPIGRGQGGLGAILDTRRVYNFTWERFGHAEIDQQWEKDSYELAKLIPESFMNGESKVGLEAGCGSGADLLRVASGRAELIGVDISDGVETAYRTTQHLANVHIVQADIHHLPFRPCTFDFIYSFGVLHHLPNPSRGLDILARLLKPESPLITYLYEDFSDRSPLERGLLVIVRGVRRITSSSPVKLLYALCWMLVPAVWLFCSVPAHLLHRPFPHFWERIPFRHTLRWPVLASDLFDRFAPPLEWRFSREGVLRLYAAAGLGRVGVRRHRGWVSWGFAPNSDPITEGHSREDWKEQDR